MSPINKTTIVSHHKADVLTLGKFSYLLCQLQAVEDSQFLLLHLLWTHLSQQLCREQHQVLHEEPHRPPGCRWDVGQGARVQAEVDVFGSGQTGTSLLDPGQRSRRKDSLI